VGRQQFFFYQNCNTRNWRYAPKGVFWCFLDPLEAGNRTTVSKKSFKNMIKKLLRNFPPPRTFELKKISLKPFKGEIRQHSNQFIGFDIFSKQRNILVKNVLKKINHSWWSGKVSTSTFCCWFIYKNINYLQSSLVPTNF
jgi:hypothetical protein